MYRVLQRSQHSRTHLARHNVGVGTKFQEGECCREAGGVVAGHAQGGPVILIARVDVCTASHQHFDRLDVRLQRCKVQWGALALKLEEWQYISNEI